MFNNESINKTKDKQINKLKKEKETLRRLFIISECESCYEKSKNIIVGQAIRQYTCINCGCETLHPNTNVPKYCNDCGLIHKICVRCGGNK